jgi:hypothetical protein
MKSNEYFLTLAKILHMENRKFLNLLCYCFDSYLRNTDIFIAMIPFFFLSLSMALQPFGPWLIFQFLEHIHSWQDSSDGGSANRKAATNTQNNINTE